MPKKSYLDSIDVPEPCDADWDKMIGDDKKRFCLSCEKDVYNLSAMSRRKARKLVARNEGKICVRYARLPNGKLYTIDQKLHQITRKTAPIAAGVIAATLSASALTYAQGEWKPLERNQNKKLATEQKAEKPEKNEIGTSQISFTVNDLTGSPIPEAKVSLTNEKTKQTISILTNSEGTALFSSLPKARYKLEVFAPHFVKESRYLKISQPIEPNIRINLEVGVVTGVVVITEKYEIPFFMAIVQEDLKTIQKMISSGFDLDTKDKDGMTALHVAVQSENLEIIKILVQSNAKINAQDTLGRTPLMMIKDIDRPTKFLKFLIDNGADVNIRDKEDSTPLMHSIFSEDENLKVVRMFLRAGAKVGAQDKKGNTALLYAADEYSAEIVEELLKAGADPNVKNKEGETPLSLAGSDKEMVKILRRYGAIK